MFDKFFDEKKWPQVSSIINIVPDGRSATGQCGRGPRTRPSAGRSCQTRRCCLPDWKGIESLGNFGTFS
jgi:hypothetical protein